MHLNEIKDKVPLQLIDVLEKSGITDLRPSQSKAIDAGLLENKNLLMFIKTR